MKRAKKKKKPKIKADVFPYFKPDKHYLVTGKELNEMRDEMADEATRKTTMLTIGGLASKLGWNEEQILDFYGDVENWNKFADDGSLPCVDVQEIVTRLTGMKFEEKWY